MNGTSLRLSEAERSRLKLGAAALGVALDETAINKLAGYADILGLWRPRTNLLACGSAIELVERHFLDSLAVESFLPDTGSVVDLGSGAGFPGVPVAIASSARTVVLVETRRRRANFLREVRRSLGLENVEIAELRAEEPGGYARSADAVVIRAVWSQADDLGPAVQWLKSGGRLFWMRTGSGTVGGVEGLEWERRESYRIGSDRLRAVEIFRIR